MTGRALTSPPAGVGDAELLARLRAGDRAALGELYRRHRARVAAYLARRMVCAGDVEDVVQETFLRLWEASDEFEPAPHTFPVWLCGRVARCTLIDYGRRDRFRQLAALDIARDHARRHPTESAHERETTPVSIRVVTALARLTPVQSPAPTRRPVRGGDRGAVGARARYTEALTGPRTSHNVAALLYAMEALGHELSGGGDQVPLGVAPADVLEVEYLMLLADEHQALHLSVTVDDGLGERVVERGNGDGQLVDQLDEERLISFGDVRALDARRDPLERPLIREGNNRSAGRAHESCGAACRASVRRPACRGGR